MSKLRLRWKNLIKVLSSSTARPWVHLPSPGQTGFALYFHSLKSLSTLAWLFTHVLGCFFDFFYMCLLHVVITYFSMWYKVGLILFCNIIYSVVYLPCLTYCSHVPWKLTHTEAHFCSCQRLHFGSLGLSDTKLSYYLPQDYAEGKISKKSMFRGWFEPLS